MRDIPRGVMSSFLRDNAETRDIDAFAGPAGSFYLRDIKRPVLFLAGGTGLAPFLSMLGKIAATGSEQPIHLIYGVTNDEDLVADRAAEAFADRIPGFTFACCVAAEAERLSAQRLRDRAHRTGAPATAATSISICAVRRRWLRRCAVGSIEQGIAPASFYFEKFCAQRA